MKVFLLPFNMWLPLALEPGFFNFVRRVPSNEEGRIFEIQLFHLNKRASFLLLLVAVGISFTIPSSATIS